MQSAEPILGFFGLGINRDARTGSYRELGLAPLGRARDGPGPGAGGG